MQKNPLEQYFRQPAIYIRLPSGGKFYPEGALIETANGEYPVLPMTTSDEITYRTPDALFNGNATVSVIESCLPNIKDAWKIPSLDIDTILTAIRIASFGHDMDISVKCPACETESDYSIDLRKALEAISAKGYDQTLDIGDISIKFQPMSYQLMNQNSLIQFEEQKMLQALEQQELDQDTRAKQLGDALKKVMSMTTKALSANIAFVKTPDVTVTDQNHIADWLSNCDRKMFATVRDAVLSCKRRTELQPLQINCSQCQNKFEQIYTLDMSNFFGGAS